MSKNIGIIIQARMGSTRLPGKVLKEINGKPLLKFILDRMKFFEDYSVIVATTSLEHDQQIINYCHDQGVETFIGSNLDVLERYYNCAKEKSFHHIVRLTADNPFTDVEELKYLIKMHLQHKADYSSSKENLPIGVGAEIFSFNALELSYFKAKSQNHKEHVNEYILENISEFNCQFINPCSLHNKHPDIRLTLDTHQDYEIISSIDAISNELIITTEQAIRLYKDLKK